MLEGTMQVATWMSSPVHTLGPGATVGEAMALMRAHRIHHLPVLDGERIVGVVSDRDLRGVDPRAPVVEVMSRPVVVVHPRTAIDKAARLLFERRIGCLPVVEDGHLVGILTQTDAVAALVDVVRFRVGGTRLELVAAWVPDAMARAQRALRGLGAQVARLVAASREPERALDPARLRLVVETREPERVAAALAAAGLVLDAGTASPPSPDEGPRPPDPGRPPA